MIYFSAAYILHKREEIYSLDEWELFIETIQMFQEDEISSEDLEAIIKRTSTMLKEYPTEILVDCN